MTSLLYTKSSPEIRGFSKDTLVYVFSSLAVLMVIYRLSDFVFEATIQSYAKFRMVDKRRWRMSTVRSLYAMFCFGISWYTILEGELIKDPVWGRNETSHMLICFTTGFFVFENVTLAILYIVHGVREAPLLLHHVLGLGFYMSVMLTGSIHFFANVNVIQEFSAPFTAMGWMLSKCGYEEKRIWIVNQVSLLVVWITCRMSFDVVVTYHIISNFKALLGTPLPVLVFFGVGHSILALFLNPYWFYKKFQQLRNGMEKQRKAAALKAESATLSSLSKPIEPPIIGAKALKRE